MSDTRRLRSMAVTLGVTAVVASTLSSCGTNDGSAICVDPQSQERVSDSYCDDTPNGAYYGDGSNYGYYPLFIPYGHSAPAVGAHYSTSTGYYKAPSGKTFSKSSVSVKGGTVKSGGFGSGFGRASS